MPLSPRRPAVVAPRGARADHPENTLVAMVAALDSATPADGIECDIRLTRDGVPVVFHDEDTLRLCEAPGSIEARSLAEVSALRVRGERIPTLADLLETTRPLFTHRERALVNIELKPTAAPDALVAACLPLLAPWVADPAVELVISSFDPRVLRSAIAARVPWRHAFLYETIAALRFLDFLKPAGALDLHPPEELASPEHLAEHAAPDRRFRVWTVDDVGRARTLAGLGVDAIITNYPARLRAALGVVSYG
jgi:glycerophosphoryl diester phosphodiesterase